MTDWYEKFETVEAEIEKVGTEYALKKGKSWQMQELKGAVLSGIMQDFIKSGKPVTQAEHLARCSPEYRQHIEETAKEIQEEGILKCKFEGLKNRFEAFRTLCSLEKSARI